MVTPPWIRPGDSARRQACNVGRLIGLCRDRAAVAYYFKDLETIAWAVLATLLMTPTLFFLRSQECCEIPVSGLSEDVDVWLSRPVLIMAWRVVWRHDIA